MTTVVLLIVFFSAVFDQGWVWLGETVIYMHATLFTLATAYSLKHNAHVRIDIFYSRLQPHGKAWVDVIGTVVFLIPTCVYILVESFPYVAESWSLRESSSEKSGLPLVFLLKTCIILMPLLLLLQGIVNAIKDSCVLLARQQ